MGAMSLENVTGRAALKSAAIKQRLAAAMAGNVHRDVQRMRDLVRFREIGR